MFQMLEMQTVDTASPYSIGNLGNRSLCNLIRALMGVTFVACKFPLFFEAKFQMAKFEKAEFEPFKAQHSKVTQR